MKFRDVMGVKSMFKNIYVSYWLYVFIEGSLSVSNCAIYSTGRLIVSMVLLIVTEKADNKCHIVDNKCLSVDNNFIRHMVTSSNGNIFRVTDHLCGEFTGPHKGQWRGALMFSLICVWINDWVNNREAGDLRGYRARYDVIVMFLK